MFFLFFLEKKINGTKVHGKKIQFFWAKMYVHAIRITDSGWTCTKDEKNWFLDVDVGWYTLFCCCCLFVIKKHPFSDVIFFSFIALWLKSTCITLQMIFYGSNKTHKKELNVKLPTVISLLPVSLHTNAGQNQRIPRRRKRGWKAMRTRRRRKKNWFSVLTSPKVRFLLSFISTFCISQPLVMVCCCTTKLWRW